MGIGEGIIKRDGDTRSPSTCSLVGSGLLLGLDSWFGTLCGGSLFRAFGTRSGMFTAHGLAEQRTCAERGAFSSRYVNFFFRTGVGSCTPRCFAHLERAEAREGDLLLRFEFFHNRFYHLADYQP